MLASTVVSTESSTTGEPKSSRGICLTTDGYECVLPFVIGERTYDTCSTAYGLPPWCMTEISWGYCSSGCPGGTLN